MRAWEAEAEPDGVTLEYEKDGDNETLNEAVRLELGSAVAALTEGDTDKDSVGVSENTSVREFLVGDGVGDWLLVAVSEGSDCVYGRNFDVRDTDGVGLDNESEGRVLVVVEEPLDDADPESDCDKEKDSELLSVTLTS